MNCSCMKNQTHPEVFKDLERKGQDLSTADGIGLFVVPAPEKGILQTRVVIVENISYAETRKRGYNCIAYQWVNKGLEWTYTSRQGAGVKIVLDSKAAIEKAQNSCVGKFCAGVGGCDPGCFCDDNTCGSSQM